MLKNIKFKKLIKLLASLKLAVVVLLVLAVIIAAGTIVESRFDATAASKWVYRTWFMRATLNLLVINLLAVMVDRWPWQKRHAPFILAHIGIIVLLFGAWVTVTFGLDGTMAVPIGQTGHAVTVPETELSVYSSFDGVNYTRLYQTAVDFFLHRPESEPIRIPVDRAAIEVLHYEPYVLPTHKVMATENTNAGPGLRFQLTNARVSFAEWLVQRVRGELVRKDLGPAQLSLVAPEQLPKKNTGKNEVFFAVDAASKVHYVISYKESARPMLQGILSEGQVVQTGWMGLELRLLRFFPHAEEGWDFQPVDRPSENTTSAIKLKFQGAEHWLQLDDVLKLFTENTVYVLTYAHRRVETGFNVHLTKFAVGHYPGTAMASSYESIVDVPGLGERKISMNEPLKYNGLTVYQASFQQDDKGEPIASVFSVNYDPGRWLKYLGSLILVFGTVLLFYNKRRAARAMGPRPSDEGIV